MKEYVVEYVIGGRTESYVIEAKDKVEARKLADEKNKKVDGFINKISLNF